VHAAGCQGRCKDVLPGACSGMRGYGVGGRHSAHAQARPEQPLRAPRPERQQQGPVRQLLQRLSRADVLRSGLVGALLVGALAHARRAACSAAAACLTPRRRAPRAGLLSSPLWLQRRARASTAAPELPTFVPAGQVRPVTCALCGRPVGHGGAERCGAASGPDEDSGGQVPLHLPTPAAPAPCLATHALKAAARRLVGLRPEACACAAARWRSARTRPSCTTRPAGAGWGAPPPWATA